MPSASAKMKDMLSNVIKGGDGSCWKTSLYLPISRPNGFWPSAVFKREQLQSCTYFVSAQQFDVQTNSSHEQVDIAQTLARHISR